MSLNVRKTRLNLYAKTFLKWSTEQQLSTFEKAAIELSLAIHNFGNQPTEASRIKLAENIGDLEVMLEIHQIAFVGSRKIVNDIKRQKLIALREKTEAKTEEEADGAFDDEGTKANYQEEEAFEPEKQGLFDRLKEWYNNLFL